jgi:hypothetical protein
MMMTAPMIGDPKMTDIAAKLPAGPKTSSNVGCASRFATLRVATESAASDRDERCFGTEDKSQPQRCERGQRDARHHVRLGASDLQAMCGNVTAIAWQSRDRDGNRKARKCAHRERPP